jgi:hypothetical protein
MGWNGADGLFKENWVDEREGTGCGVESKVNIC